MYFLLVELGKVEKFPKITQEIQIIREKNVQFMELWNWVRLSVPEVGY